jgi:MFS family permease
MAEEPRRPAEDRPRRRLPVLNAPPPDEKPPEDRAPHEWVIATAVTTVLAWLLLGGSANALAQRVTPDSVAIIVAVNVVSLLLAAAAGGALAGRFGARAKRRHPVLGAMAAAAFGWALGVSKSNPSELPVWLLLLAALLAIAASGAALGYRATRRA